MHKRESDVAAAATARKIITLVLSIIMLTGTITSFYPTLSSSTFIRNAQGQSIDKVLNDIDCNNINLNGNDISIDTLPPSLSGLGDFIQSEDSDDGISNSEQRAINDFIFKCINNNKNEFNKTQNPIQSPHITPPPPIPTEILTVVKNVTCLADTATCEQNPIQPSNFTIVIDGNNPSKNNFPGESGTGTDVKLEAGQYNVTEQGLDVVTPEICTNMDFEAGKVFDSTSGLFICTNFSDDCEGEIAIGSPQTCRIDNVLVTTPPPIAGNNVCTVWQDNAPGKDEIFFSGSPDDGETFTTPLNISRNAENSKESQVKCDGNNVYAAWEDETTTFANNDIFFSFSHDNGQTFSTKNISNNTGDSLDVQIAAKGNNVYLVWEDNTRDVGDISFARSTDGGQTFSNKTISNNPAGGFGSYDPQISLQGNNIYVVWAQDGFTDNFPDIFFTRSTDGGQTFSEPENISNINGRSQVPQISSEDDNVYVVWEDETTFFNNEDILFSFSHDNGQTFSQPINLSNSTGRSFDPQISSQGNNTYVVWEEFDDNDDIFFARITDGGQTFSTKNISNNTGNSFSQQISSEGNNVYMVWRDDTPGNRDIFFARSTDGGQTFSTKNISNSTGFSSNPQISSEGNNVYVVWQDFTSSGGSDIFFTFSLDSGQTFSEPENLSESTGDSSFPQISSNTQTQQQSTNNIITTAGNNNDHIINDLTTKGITTINSIIEQEEKQKLAEEQKIQQSDVMSPPSIPRIQYK